LHLVFLWDRQRGAFDAQYQEFVDEVRAAAPDVVLVSGDIAEAPELTWYLDRLEADLPGRQICFVLGNHDAYRGSIRAVRREVAAFCAGRPRLVYLTAMDAPLALTDRVAVVGHDGWADGRFGELEWSRAKINDFVYIEELREAGEEGRRAALNRLGDEAAVHLRMVLSQAVATFPRIVLVTHVPPWLEAARYAGRVCDYEYAPHFASKAAGEAIVEVMRDAPQCELTVLCGHTHSAAEHRPLPNVVCLAGQAEYGQPRVQRVFELGGT
jgi:predicted phosphohydrolase